MVHHNQQERCNAERVRRAKHNEQMEILKKQVIHRLSKKKSTKKHTHNEILWAAVEHVAFLRRILEESEDLTSSGEISEVPTGPMESSSSIMRHLKPSEVPQDHRLPISNSDFMTSSGIDSESQNLTYALQKSFEKSPKLLQDSESDGDAKEVEQKLVELLSRLEMGYGTSVNKKETSEMPEYIVFNGGKKTFPKAIRIEVVDETTGTTVPTTETKKTERKRKASNNEGISTGSPKNPRLPIRDLQNPTMDRFNSNFLANYGQGFSTEQFGYYDCNAQQYQHQYYSNPLQQQMCSNSHYYNTFNDAALANQYYPYPQVQFQQNYNGFF